MKGHGLIVSYSPPNFLFLSIKAFSFPCYVETSAWLTMVVDLELQFSADPNKPIFNWRNIWQSTCFRSTF